MRIEVESDHWYTPEWLLESLSNNLFFETSQPSGYTQMFDPCTCHEAVVSLKNKDLILPAPVGRVQGRASCSRAQLLELVEWDFLSVSNEEIAKVAGDRPWFMNPPYSRDVGTAGAFTDRLLAYYPRQWAVLVNASVETRWFQDMMIESDYMVLWPRRIKFERAAGLERIPGTSPRYSNALFIRGVHLDSVSRFAEEHGLIIMGQQ